LSQVIVCNSQIIHFYCNTYELVGLYHHRKEEGSISSAHREERLSSVDISENNHEESLGSKDISENNREERLGSADTFVN
jgi:hypothetical protein